MVLIESVSRRAQNQKNGLGGGRCLFRVFSTLKRSSTRFGHHQQTFEYEATTFSFKLTKEGTAAT
jgi:hypothetical protein